MIARIARNLSTLRHALLDLLFPPRCVICRRVGEWFCAICRQAVEKILPPICDRCGRPLGYADCPYCKKLALQIDGTRATAFFEGNLRQAIHVFTYNHQPELAMPLGDMLNDNLTQHPLPVDVLVPIPLHGNGERARGYNQATLMARVLGQKRNLPVWDTAITRIRLTRPPIELDASVRHANVRDAFTATDQVTGKHVWLNDAVFTTVATMEECGVT